ncbi:D-alanyl-D-alanine-carboxypeptidase/endopeptidase AmpH [Thalassorhabdomicrobium marinisediminis]|uniref:D-alanyl-D-alanine- carboxypeptidase/endopeptidase AmpH n=1 Tax=Thalassorhabdomicrobium marinisediminis TaxID=2170577 RepID=UPI0024900B29|nr:D-alanyl-D-alanine-carboxypeptidase/endopeptidase AmpH [Thalassorhabdomicrobium marinisediminis]
MQIVLRRAWVSAVALAGLIAASAAQADALLDEAVAFNGAILHLQMEAPGLIVAAVKDGETAVMGFGETRRGSGIEPDGDSVFRIGSITKAFAGEMLAHSATRGEVVFTDKAGDLLQGRLGEALAEHPPMRLVELATHAAGLPREVPRAESPADDPFANITYDAFADWLEANPLHFAPGSSIAYSNFGFDILSAALSEAGGKPYADLLAERITGPLDMADTGFELTEAKAGRVMAGHAPDGTPLPTFPSGSVITGSGGLYSTANDLLRWMQWHLDHGEPDAEVRLLDHLIYTQRDGMDAVLAMDESGRMDAMGLGWVAMAPTAERPFILQKAGALQGQMSYLAFAPEHGTAVFVSINQFDFAGAYAMTEFANSFLADLSGF